MIDQLVGKTSYMQSVHITNLNKDLLGKIIDVKIIRAGASSLTGEI